MSECLSSDGRCLQHSHCDASHSATRRTNVNDAVFAGSNSAFTTTGPCVVEGHCIESGNVASGQPQYNNDESCTITAHGSGTLSATQFDTEHNYDFLHVGTHKYSGSQGPSEVAVQPSTPISWASDRSNTRSGWKICLASGTASPGLRAAKCVRVGASFIKHDT